MLGAANAPDTLLRVYGGSDKRKHGYLGYYRRHLGRYRLARNVVFEIGVGRYASRSVGGSLALWRDYLPRSVIVGIDIYDKDVRIGRTVKFAQADQNDPAQLQAVVDLHGRPDIVIDDGSHVGEHINTSFEHLWPQLRPGGMYVIEDLATSYAPHFGGGHPPPAESGVGLAQSLVSDVQASDHGFAMYPQFSAPPSPKFADLAAVHAYPGIAFIEKAR
ncbi:MAG: hypothetical protein QOC66_4132 [Pseudonocardiales bacterium]|nr:hypothetical protein [Pseudonocardiales bacterium]